MSQRYFINGIQRVIKALQGRIWLASAKLLLLYIGPLVIRPIPLNLTARRFN
jgi:hypothetical protein